MLTKLKPKSEFSRNVLTLMTGTTIAQAIPIAISPILTRMYSPEEFGVLALFVALASIFGSMSTGRYALAILLPKDNKENTIKVYSNHNKEVIEYFKDRPNDLLVIDFTTGEKWDSLCKFLKQPIPETTFPHINKVNYNKPMVNRSVRNKIKVLRKRIKYYLKIRYIDLLNLWPRESY